jgi:hypothetical protein
MICQAKKNICQAFKMKKSRQAFKKICQAKKNICQAFKNYSISLCLFGRLIEYILPSLIMFVTHQPPID